MNGVGAVIRVLLVDDHAIERQGVRSLLDAQADMTVVGEAPDGLEALQLVGLRLLPTSSSPRRSCRA